MTDTTNEASDGRQVRPFAAWLQEQERGALHADLSEGLQDLVTACHEHGRMGTMTLTVKVQPEDDGMTTFVQCDVSMKPPKASRAKALFYADAAGNLHRSDPHQQQLPLRDVNAEPEIVTPLGVVNAATGELRSADTD